MTSTITHTLPLKLGRVFRVDVTETPTTVFIHVGGDRPRPSERAAVEKFMWPIVNRFEEDDRPIEIDGSRNRGPACRLYTLGRNRHSVVVGVSEVPRPRPNA